MCYARVASECSTGRCSTVFDDVPGAREQFGVSVIKYKYFLLPGISVT